MNISDVINRLSKLRYSVDVDYQNNRYAYSKPNPIINEHKDKNGEYVKWNDVLKILNDL